MHTSNVSVVIRPLIEVTCRCGCNRTMTVDLDPHQINGGDVGYWATAMMEVVVGVKPDDSFPNVLERMLEERDVVHQIKEMWDALHGRGITEEPF